jgi:hypothetical protein
MQLKSGKSGTAARVEGKSINVVTAGLWRHNARVDGETTLRNTCMTPSMKNTVSCGSGDVGGNLASEAETPLLKKTHTYKPPTLQTHN